MPRIESPYVRVAIVWLAMVAIWVAMTLLRHAWHGDSYTLGGHIQSAMLAAIVGVGAVVAARRWLDRGTVAGLGLQLSPAALKPFAVGALSFLIPSAVAFAVVLGFGWVSIVPAVPLGESLAFLPLLVALVFLYEALPEELAFRGYIYRALAERLPRMVAVGAQAFLFAGWGAAIWIVAFGTVAFDRIAIFLAVGAVLGAVRVISGSVWTSIGLHTAFQTVAQWLLNEERGHFAIENSGTMQLIALGVIPFAFAAALVALVYRGKVAWRQPEGPPVPVRGASV